MLCYASTSLGPCQSAWYTEPSTAAWPTLLKYSYGGPPEGVWAGKTESSCFQGLKFWAWIGNNEATDPEGSFKPRAGSQITRCIWYGWFNLSLLLYLWKLRLFHFLLQWTYFAWKVYPGGQRNIKIRSGVRFSEVHCWPALLILCDSISLWKDKGFLVAETTSESTIHVQGERVVVRQYL